jgi:hypothetical protein
VQKIYFGGGGIINFRRPKRPTKIAVVFLSASEAHENSMFIFVGLGKAIKNFILWPRRDVELVDWSNSSQAQPSPPSQIVVPIVHPSSPPQTSHAAPHPLSDPPSPHPHGGPPSPPHTSPFRDPPSTQPSRDPRPSKKSKVSIPKLVSPFEKKKEE